MLLFWVSARKRLQVSLFLTFLILCIKAAPLFPLLPEHSILDPASLRLALLKSPVCFNWSALAGLSGHHTLCLCISSLSASVGYLAERRSCAAVTSQTYGSPYDSFICTTYELCAFLLGLTFRDLFNVTYGTCKYLVINHVTYHFDLVRYEKWRDHQGHYNDTSSGNQTQIHHRIIEKSAGKVMG